MGMPVVLVNPTRRKRRNKRRNARRKRRNPRRARAGSLARRRNPRVRSMKEGAIGGMLSSLGGVVAYGLHFGSSYAPVGNIGQTLILAGAGTVTSIGTAWFADDRAAWGIMGGTIALVTGRSRRSPRTTQAPTASTRAELELRSQRLPDDSGRAPASWCHAARRR